MSKSKSTWNKGIQLLIDNNINDTNFSRLYNLFSNLALNRFKWDNLPNGIESRHIEKALFLYGQCAFYEDSNLGLICLPCSPANSFNVYGDPLSFNLFGIGYNKVINNTDCVRILSNDNAFPMIAHTRYYADKISKADKTIDVNLEHQKTPYIVATSKQNELTFKNYINKLQQDEYAIFIDDKLTNGGSEGIYVSNTMSPFIIDKVQAHKNNLMCEMLTLLGLNNTDSNNLKKERLLVDEVNANNQEIHMYAETEFKNRMLACEEINKRYGLNMTVKKVLNEELIDDVSHEINE